MPDNIIRTKGRGQGYKFDRGGTPAEFGPFIGRVKNNIDPTRSGRLQVFIEQFAGEDEEDESLWRTVSYIPPFYGATQHNGTSQGVGTFTGNQQSYGMWFTPPDLGVSVICFFVEGDPNQGYYIGVVPDSAVNHMVPAIGASTKFQLSNGPQDRFFQGAKQLPVTEINTDNESITQNPRFFDQTKPVHSVVAGIMFQQGIIKDTVRGPITSNSQRESPSAVFGVSTPGKPIYQGGLSETDIKNQLERGELLPQDVQVIARRGGHSIVLDDGDLEGKDTLVRIRTAKGHQITMSDDGDCFYIIHANGQTWMEFGKQGTVDVFSTNSVNVRTQGTINLHADRDINMFAGGGFYVKAKNIKMQADARLDLIATNNLTLYSKNFLGVRSDGTLAMKSVQSGNWDAGQKLKLKADCIDLNGGGAPAPVNAPPVLKDFRLVETVFNPESGWINQPGKLATIVTRAPTHEPYPYHNQGVANLTQLQAGSSDPLNVGASQTLASLRTVIPEGAIDAATFLAQPEAAISIGSLDIPQVTGLLAQAASFVDQPFDEISVEKGLGKFGLSAEQLEVAGYLKPGTVQQFLSDPSQLTSVLSSPAVWTGRAGVDSLAAILGNPDVQAQAQQDIMSGALEGLQSLGIVTGNENASDLGALVQTASKFGIDTAASWVSGQAPPNLVNQINGLAKGAQQAINLVGTRSIDTSLQGTRLGGFVDTVNRGSLDQAVAGIIDNAKIPVPNFSQGLYSGVPNAELVYSGDDPIVLDRINEERRKRGLPPLALGSGIET